jgi:hypothetical protein
MNERILEDPSLSTADFAAGGSAKMVREEKPAALLHETEAETFRSRWTEIQAGFVDEPRQAVEKADNLVASAMKRIAEMFAEERSNLEKQWSRGDDVSTEDLRLALQRYRSFFNRLLTM